MTEPNKPKPFRTLRGMMASIAVHEELQRKAPEGSDERRRISYKLDVLHKELDEAQAVWLAWNMGQGEAEP